MGAKGDMDAAEKRRLGRTGGALLIIGSLAALPAAFVLNPSPATVEHLVGLAGALVGLAIWTVPWERMSSRSLYLIPLVGTAEVMVGTAVFSDDFAFYQVLIGVYTAYLVQDRVHFLAFMAVFTLATVAPLVYLDNDANGLLHHIFVTLPVLLISAGVVRYLRLVLEMRERQYRHFALEAVSLAERIRGGPPSDRLESAEDVERRLAELVSETAPER
ncbi:MAG: hypothetical protein WKF62_04445 [Solirubrobacterales bacterium]